MSTVNGVGSALVGRRTVSRPLTDEDYGFAQGLALNYELSWPWPGPMTNANFHRSLWDGVVLQHVICGRQSGEPLAVVALYNASHVHRHAYLRAHGRPEAQGLPESIALFVDLCFRRYELSKIYIESGETQFSQFASVSPELVQVEGRLKSHLRIDGKIEDLLIGAIYQDQWDTLFAKWREYVEPSAGGDPHQSGGSRP